VALPHEVAGHVLVDVGLLPGAERTVGDAAAGRALPLIVAEVVDHGLAVQLLFERGVLAAPRESCEPPRFGVLVGLVLAQLLLGRRHLLRLGADHTAGQRLQRRRHRLQLGAYVIELGALRLRLLAPGTVVIVG
jgi:hypothetical protein